MHTSQFFNNTGRWVRLITVGHLNMNSYFYLITALVLGLSSLHSSAADYTQLDVDLDGDKRPETIVASASVSDSGSEEYQKFSIRIGSETYTGRYYAVDGDLPTLTIIAIDQNRSSRQLLVKMQEPLSCEYHVLAYSAKKLIPLLQFQTDAGCNAQPHGDGTLGVTTWEGFWKRDQNYRLNPAGTLLTLQPQEFYSVGISAIAGKDFALEKAQCQQTIIKQGSKILVEKYDIAHQRYLLISSTSTCGWLQEKNMHDYIYGLPWAD